MSWVITGAPGTGDNLLYSQAGTPALDLRFASTKSLTDYVSGQNRVTFTRASSGTFVGSDGLIQTAASNTPRFDHNPATGESLGLLVEEARTNLALYSEQFENAWWTKDNTTVVTNVTNGPDGTATADKIVETATSSSHSVYRNITLTNAIYTYSVFLKKSERNWAYVRLATVVGQGAYFNLNTGTIGTIESGITATMQNAGNGWYRCSVSITTSVLPWYPQHGPTTGDNTPSYTGNGSSGIFAWGAQLEAGAFPTSYIPTTSATVTRAADVASIAGANFSSWYNQTEGTAFTQYSGQAGGRVFMADDGTTNNRFEVRILSNTSQLGSWSGGTQDVTGLFAPAATGLVDGVVVKTAVGLKVNDAAISTNGFAVGTDTSCAMPIALNRMILGSFQSSATFLNGPIRRLTYWPTRLANTTLQTITQ
jgi:hypothetical protein